MNRIELGDEQENKQIINGIKKIHSVIVIVSMIFICGIALFVIILSSL